MLRKSNTQNVITAEAHSCVGILSCLASGQALLRLTDVAFP